LVDKELKFIFTKMDILSYLAELIQTNKEVGVPELGTFLKKKLPGRYDAELHSFLPPGYQLFFLQEVTEDTLLSEYICRKHNLSEESANYHIDQFVANVKEQLTDTGEAALKSLGKLELLEGELKFHANPALNLGFKFYGLPEIAEEITPKENEETLEAIITENNLEEENPGNIPEEPIYQQEPEILLEEAEATGEESPQEVEEEIKAPLIVEPEVAVLPTDDLILDTTAQKEPVPTYLKITIGILILLTLILALFLWNPDWFENINSRQKAEQRSVAAVDSTNLKTDTVVRQDTARKDTIKQETAPAAIVKKDTVPTAPLTSETITPVTSPAATGPQVTTFEVIGSSVYSEKEARQFIAFMKRKWGVNAKIVSQLPGKKIKISIATYKDEKTAREERARLEEKIQIPGLYIYTNTHKKE
jgi:hypothetical protein